MSASQPPGVPSGGGGGVGIPTYKPQNDPHEALTILDIHKWGKKSFQQKFAHQPRLPSAKVRPEGQVWGLFFFVCFSPIFDVST